MTKLPLTAAASLALSTLLTGCATKQQGTTINNYFGRAGEPTYLPGPNPDAPFSASVAYGELVFVAGKLSPERGDIRAEARGAIGEIKKELARHDLDLSDIVQATVYLADIEYYAPFNEVYTELMEKPYPARAAFAVAALPRGA
ncbi:MAG: RidA family protein, partial [Planctomycetota bacterium]